MSGAEAIFRPAQPCSLITRYSCSWAAPLHQGRRRGFLANPDFVERVRRGAPLNAPEPIGVYGGDHRGYTDYPTLEQAQPVRT